MTMQRKVLKIYQEILTGFYKACALYNGLPAAEAPVLLVAVLQTLGDLSRIEGNLDKEAHAGLEFAKIVTQGMLGSILADQGENRQAEQYLQEALETMDTLGLEIEAKNEFRERYRTIAGLWF